jgi:tryptophan synthase beta chain
MVDPISRNITFALSSESIPRAWYNATADLPFVLPPPIHPGTRRLLEPADLAAIFPEELIAQEMSTER